MMLHQNVYAAVFRNILVFEQKNILELVLVRITFKNDNFYSNRCRHLRNRKRRKNNLFWTYWTFFITRMAPFASVPASPHQKIAPNVWLNCNLLTASDPDSLSVSPHLENCVKCMILRWPFTCLTFFSLSGWPVRIAAGISATENCVKWLI